jgi:aspartyl protease family protein
MLRVIITLCVFFVVVGAGLGRDIAKFFARSSESTMASNAARSAPPPPVSTYRTVRLESDKRGQFLVEARIDGRRIELVVDTGATSVALRESTAARLGIFPKPTDYIGRAQTANGIVRIAPVRLNRIDINGIVAHDVEASVIPDEALKENLLGMSFLSKVRFSHERGRLVLEQ